MWKKILITLSAVVGLCWLTSTVSYAKTSTDENWQESKIENSKSSTSLNQEKTTTEESTTSETTRKEASNEANTNGSIENKLDAQNVTATSEEAFTIDTQTGFITGYDVTKGGTDVVIPDTINGVTVTGIADSNDGIFGYKGITSVQLPDTLTVIGKYAFQGNPNLTTIQLPKNLTTIWQNAFANCGLTSLSIPDSVTILDQNAFSHNKLTDVTIGAGVKKIGSGAFENNPLVNLDLGQVVTIGDSAFNLTSLTKLILPSTVTTIDSNAFRASSITSLNWSENLSYIGNEAFNGNKLTSIEIPDSITHIGSYAFAYNQLTSVKLGSGLKTLQKGVFKHNQINAVDLGQVLESIGESAFESNQLKELALPDSVTNIGAIAFRQNQLNAVTWGTGLKSIGCEAFTDNLFTNLTLTAETIDDESFKDNPLLETVKLTDSVKTVGKATFAICPKLKNVDLGKVESIGDGAFQNGLIETVSLPTSLKTVGNVIFVNNKLPFIELNATNPRVNYGLQHLSVKKIDRSETALTEGKVDITKLYPGIDKKKVNITKVTSKKSGLTEDVTFNYDSDTGILTYPIADPSITGYTVYYDYVIDGTTVLSVEQPLEWGTLSFTAPTTLDFGSQTLTKGTHYYPVTNTTGNALTVTDGRGTGSKWQLTAKVTKPLTNANNKTIANGFVYKTGTDEMVLGADAQNIQTHTTTTDTEDTAISANWNASQGLLLKIDAGKAYAGAYSGTIEWTLNDAP